MTQPRLAFRNLTASPSDPVSTWPTEAVQAALERGDLPDWRRIAVEIEAAPWGRTSRQVEEVLSHSRPYGVTELMESVIARARTLAEQDERAAVAARIRSSVLRAGLTQAQFAQPSGRRRTGFRRMRTQRSCRRPRCWCGSSDSAQVGEQHVRSRSISSSCRSRPRIRSYSSSAIASASCAGVAAGPAWPPSRRVASSLAGAACPSIAAGRCPLSPSPSSSLPVIMHRVRRDHRLRPRRHQLRRAVGPRLGMPTCSVRRRRGGRMLNPSNAGTASGARRGFIRRLLPVHGRRGGGGRIRRGLGKRMADRASRRTTRHSAPGP